MKNLDRLFPHYCCSTDTGKLGGILRGIVTFRDVDFLERDLLDRPLSDVSSTFNYSSEKTGKAWEHLSHDMDPRWTSCLVSELSMMRSSTILECEPLPPISTLCHSCDWYSRPYPFLPLFHFRIILNTN